MRKPIVLLAVMSVLVLCGCDDAGRDIKPTYPRITYRNSTYNFDPYNKEIAVESGYILDEGHSFDLVETENGYDIVLHFVSAEGAKEGGDG